MANSRTLLVYVLALVVCGSSSFWVSANTVPVLREPVAASGASSPQKHQQQHYRIQLQKQQQLPTAQHQQIQETSRTPSSLSSPSPSPATPVAQPSSNNNNNAPSALSIKNAWGLSAGNSDSGPYTAGYGYILGNTLQQPVPYYKNDYQLMEPKQSRQMANIFEGFTPALQSFFGNGLDIKSILFGGLMTYAVTNLGIPESMNSLIPVVKYFRSRVKEVADLKKDKVVKVAAEPLKETAENSDVVKEVSDRKDEVSAKDTSSKKESVSNKKNAPVKDVAAKKDEEVPTTELVSSKEEANATDSRRRRDVSIQPDTDLTQLAVMVLSAIQSGECMQRSICILGSQIGASNKGRVAFTLVDKLVPESVQGNQYFVTMKKALRGGESFCDRFRCRLN